MQEATGVKLPELSKDDKLAMRDIQHQMFVVHVRAQALKNELQNCQNLLAEHQQSLERKALELATAAGLDIKEVSFDMDALEFIKRPQQ